MILDAYTHISPKQYLKELLKLKDPSAVREAHHLNDLDRIKPGFSEVNERIADMDRFGISAQATMIHSIIEPNTFQETQKENLRLTGLINDEVANLHNVSGQRITGLGSVPLHALENGGVEEMVRAVRDLDLRGFMVPTNARGIPIDRFPLMWETAEKLDVPVYIHPVDSPVSASRVYEQEYDLMHVLGWPYETGLLWMRLVLSGILSKHRNLKIVTHHLGGIIPFLLGRIEESYHSKASKVLNVKGETYDVSSTNPSKFLKNFYYDTAIGGSLPALRMGLELLGAENMIFSTDYPWGPEAGKLRLSSYPGLVNSLDIGDKEKELIFSGNAKKLLKLTL